ncbi:MAG: nuclear transport factor 2 family protein [Gemmatimonadetes bacterium]|nr:nuclear transport factor 2 family protein [Gemmatimonadota bacterium]
METVGTATPRTKAVIQDVAIRTVVQFAVALSLLGSSLGEAQTPGPSDESLFAAREAVWRAYFANAPELAQVLPNDFVGIVAGDSAWADRAATLTGAKASVARGTRLVALRFPRNVVQRYGSVAILHSRYEAEFDGPDGPNTMRGQITEVFVWSGSRWIHPAWHMEIDH